MIEIEIFKRMLWPIERSLARIGETFYSHVCSYLRILDTTFYNQQERITKAAKSQPRWTIAIFSNRSVFFGVPAGTPASSPAAESSPDSTKRTERHLSTESNPTGGWCQVNHACIFIRKFQSFVNFISRNFQCILKNQTLIILSR